MQMRKGCMPASELWRTAFWPAKSYGACHSAGGNVKRGQMVQGSSRGAILPPLGPAGHRGCGLGGLWTDSPDGLGARDARSPGRKLERVKSYFCHLHGENIQRRNQFGTRTVCENTGTYHGNRGVWGCGTWHGTVLSVCRTEFCRKWQFGTAHALCLRDR